MPDIINPLCTLAWAEKFFSEYAFHEYWENASSEKKTSALKTATHFIENFVFFYDEKGNPYYHSPDGSDDYENEVIPMGIKQACAIEAEYILSLDDNPAEPLPVTILGLSKADNKTIDPDFSPPIFPIGVVRLLEREGGEVNPDATGGKTIQVSAITHTF